MEYRKALDKVKMDELHVIHIAYELQIKNENQSRKEVSFKDNGRTKYFSNQSDKNKYPRDTTGFEPKI